MSATRTRSKAPQGSRRKGLHSDAAITSRRQRQQRAQAMRRLRLAIVATAVLTVLIAGYRIPRSSLFIVRHVEITGTSAVPDPMVRNTVDSLLHDVTIYSLDLDEIERRVRDLPFIRSAKVERHFPNGVSIQVREYGAIAFGLSSGQPGGWLIARDGRILAAAHLDDWKERVPVIRLAAEGLAPGKKLPPEPTLDLLRAMSPTFPGRFTHVDVTNQGLIGYLSDGRYVRFGRPDELAVKLRVVERLMALPELTRASGMSYIDVSVPSRPAVKL